MAEGRIIFVTGTDTGVGKTVLTALLLTHLRENGFDALAMKPFCSGSRDDVRVIMRIQGARLRIEEVNPFYFQAPVTPMVAGEESGSVVRLSQVLRLIRRAARRCDFLLVEGAGGLLSPLGRRFNLLHVIENLAWGVIVVCPDKLGAINQTLLTIGALRHRNISKIKVVLMGQRRKDVSTKSNRRVLRTFLSQTPVETIPFLGRNPEISKAFGRAAKKNKKTLATISRADTFSARCSKRMRKSKRDERLKTKKVR